MPGDYTSRPQVVHHEQQVTEHENTPLDDLEFSNDQRFQDPKLKQITVMQNASNVMMTSQTYFHKLDNEEINDTSDSVGPRVEFSGTE